MLFSLKTTSRTDMTDKCYTYKELQNNFRLKKMKNVMATTNTRTGSRDVDSLSKNDKNVPNHEIINSMDHTSCKKLGIFKDE